MRIGSKDRRGPIGRRTIGLVRQFGGGRGPAALMTVAAFFAVALLTASVVSGASTAAGVASATPAVAADKADYAPGDTVVLTGTGWQAGEAVHLAVNDSEGDSWSYTADVTALGDGTFTDTFGLPDWFVATYTVTATGALSGVATTTFTDSLGGYYEGTTATGTCSNVSNVLSSDNNRATCARTLTPNGQNAVVSGFGLQSIVPATATAIGFNIEIEGNRTGFNRQISINLSWDGGSSFTVGNNTSSFDSSTDQIRTYPTSSATSCSNFSRTWAYSELSDANFRVRVVPAGGTSSTDSVNIDRIRVRACWDGSTVTRASIAEGLTAVASPSAPLRAALEVNHLGPDPNDNWRCTKYQIGAAVPVNVNHGNHDSPGTDDEGFSINAPSSPGTYDLSFTAYRDDACTLGASPTFTLPGAITVGLFGDSFGVTGPDTVPGWVDGDAGGSDCALRTRTGVVGDSDGNAYLRLRSNCITTRSSISTAGLGGIHLKYNWGQEDNDGGADTGSLVVQWKPTSSGSWTTLDTQSLTNNVDADPTSPKDLDLGGTASNTSIDIRFQGTSGDDDLRALVDDVIVTGSAVQASDAPVVNSPICAGATSVSGTSSEPDGTSIEVFKNTVSVGTTTVGSGTWTKGSLAALIAGDQIKAKATASGETVSGDSNVVTVASCNATPTADAQSLTFGEDSTNNAITLTGNANDAGQTLTFYVDTLPANGTLSETSGGPSLTVDTALADADLFFTPNANYCTTGNSFQFYVKDSSGAVNDTSANATISISVTCVNDPPVATDDDASGTEDTLLVIAKATLIGNDSDGGDGGALSLTAVSNPSGGTVQINGDNVEFTPTANLCGTDVASFDYTVSDTIDTDTGTVTIDLTCVNDAPVAVDDSYTTNEDTNLVLEATKDAGLPESPADNDTDADNDTLTVSAVSSPTGGTVSLVSGTITFDPADNVCEPGSYGFDYTISDGNGGTDSGHADVTITCVNDPPVATDDDASGTEDTLLVIAKATLIGNDSDGGDGGALSLTAVSNPSGGTVQINGDNVEFTPTANLCGTDVASFDYTVSDTIDTDTGRVTIDLTCVNDPPVFTGGGNVSVLEDSGAYSAGWATGISPGGGADESGQSVSFIVSNDSPALFSVQPAVSPGGTLTFTPAPNANGSATVSVTAKDSGTTANGGDDTSDTQQFTLTVTAVNDAPAFGTFPANAGGQYTDPVDANTLTAGVQALTLSATDIESVASTLVFSVNAGSCTDGQELPADLTLANNGNGTATISGNFDIIPGTYTPCIVVTDTNGGATAQKLTLKVEKEDASIVDIEPSSIQSGQTANITAKFAEADDGNTTSAVGIDTEGTAFGATTVGFSLTGFASASHTGACNDTPVGFPPVACSISGLLADAYQIDATIGGPWFTGDGIGTLAVIDPANGFATGGGWFPWDGGKTNFAFTGKLLKKNAQGGVLLVLHTADGPYVIKSNSFGGLTNGSNPGPPAFWYTTMSGKATYGTPDTIVNPYCSPGVRKCGNFQFLVYAEDRGEPGAGKDTYRMRLIAPDGTVVLNMTLPQTISGGNVQVPHK